MSGDAKARATDGMLVRMRWSTVAAWVMALLVAQPTRWVEPFLILGALQALVHVPGFAPLVGVMGVGRRAVIWVLLFLMLLGQFSRGDGYWPFVRWNMYSARQPNPVYYEWKAVLADGDEVDFPFCQFAPGSNCRAFVFAFNWRLLEPALTREGDGEVPREAIDNLSDALEPLVRLYNAGTEGPPIVAVRGTRYRWSFAHGAKRPRIVGQWAILLGFDEEQGP